MSNIAEFKQAAPTTGPAFMVARPRDLRTGKAKAGEYAILLDKPVRDVRDLRLRVKVGR